MRVEYTDERDVTWERNDPHFRIYRFEGADNAVTTLDVLDSDIVEALDVARRFSNDDEHLWALGLVENDARDLRGLIWLSGMDYNDTPGTVREWQLRRQMQDRFLSARSARGLAPVLPNGLRVIRMFPEWRRGWPLWESFGDAYELTGPDLGLSAPLSDALYEWNGRWCSRPVDGPVPSGWREEGDALFARLQAELSGVAEVRPEYAY